MITRLVFIKNIKIMQIEAISWYNVNIEKMLKMIIKAWHYQIYKNYAN